MLFDLLKVFNLIESSQKSDFSSSMKCTIMFNACATCLKLLSYIGTLELTDTLPLIEGGGKIVSDEIKSFQ